LHQGRGFGRLALPSVKHQHGNLATPLRLHARRRYTSMRFCCTAVCMSRVVKSGISIRTILRAHNSRAAPAPVLDGRAAGYAPTCEELCYTG
jgi:hypothetical protein